MIPLSSLKLFRVETSCLNQPAAILRVLVKIFVGYVVDQNIINSHDFQTGFGLSKYALR